MNRIYKQANKDPIIQTERVFHSLVTLILEIVCVVLLLVTGYMVYDTITVEKSAVLDSYIKELKPEVKVEDKKVVSSLDELQKINPDVVAWITIDDTKIDYPVLQGRPDYTYLSRDIYGNSSLSGSLYIGIVSNRYFEDDFTIIYGHHMAGGLMFGALDYYVDETYLQEHSVGTLITENKVYDLKVLAFMTMDAYSEIYSKTTMEYWDKFINEDEYEILSGNLDTEYNKLLLLSTCGPNGNTDRYLLILRMEEKRC